MLKKLNSYEDVALALLNEGQIQRALDVLQELSNSQTTSLHSHHNSDPSIDVSFSSSHLSKERGRGPSHAGLKFSIFKRHVQGLLNEGHIAKADIVSTRLLELKRVSLYNLYLCSI